MSIELTPSQRSAIRQLLKYRGRNGSVLEALRTNLPLYIFQAVACAIAALLLQNAFGPVGAVACVTFWAGIVLRDIAWLRRSALLWRALQGVVDWQRIESLAKDESPPSA